MKKIVSITLLLAVATLTIQAQNTPQKTQEISRHKDRHEDSFRELQLTEDQKAKFKSINDEFHQQMQDLEKKDDITVKEWKARMQTLKNDHRTKVQSLLTSEQKEKLKQLKVERKSRYKVDRDERAQRMKTRLGLTDDQAAKLKASHTEMSEKMKAIRENKSLTEDQRKEESRQLKEKQKENLRSILSEEQFKKLQENRKDKPARSV